MGKMLGTSALNSTWAVVRSPMWKGSGYRGMTLPANKNQWDFYNGTYVENLGRLTIAFPFRKANTGVDYWSSSMCLGVNLRQIQAPNDEADPPVPAIYEFYLSHGEGRWFQFGSSSLEQVLNGYLSSSPLSSGIAGYDTPRTRDQYRGAVVNVTFTPGPTMTPVTTNVTITDDLFPDNLNWNVFGPQGILIGTYTWPVPSGGLTWDQPYWTINSLTMP